MKKCLFAGTFDPFTLGHSEIVDKCATLFDEVHVVVMVNPTKVPYYSRSQRVRMAELATAKYPNVKVASHDGLLVDYLKENDIVYNARGVRDTDDFTYEMDMSRRNEEMYPPMTTIFFPSDPDLSQISSSLVKYSVKKGAPLDKYLCAEVAEYIRKLK